MSGFVSLVVDPSCHRYAQMYGIRGGPLRCMSEVLKIGTWNVEGLTQEKIVEL